MRVYLISANNEWLPDPVPPLGLSYVAAAAESEGHECRVFDCNFQDVDQDMISDIRAFQPHLIGLSVRNVDNTAFPMVVSYLDHYRQVATLCRKASEAPLILGGAGFSLFPEAFVRELGADLGIMGEGESTFVDLLKRMKGQTISEIARNGRILSPTTFTETLGRITPARHLIDIDAYFQHGGSINIQSKRGCAFQCAYCTYPMLEGRKPRLRPPENVVDEMEVCLDRFGADYFFFVDSVFNHPHRHAKAICREIIRRHLKIRWTAQVSPTKPDAEMYALFAQSGCCSLDFGTDAASPLSLHTLHKSFSLEDIAECSRLCQAHHLKFNHSLLLGVPGETMETVNETMERMDACNPTAVTVFVGVRLYRGTEIANKLIAKGWIKEEEISINPLFFVEESIREPLLERMTSLNRTHPNWIVPGMKIKMNERFFRRKRLQGVKGPLWEALKPAISHP